ncbi:NAD(P)-binding domain-containing protein [Streptomyces sp. NPDC056257]|uniref:NAD(P)-binding domain-containing protein n=1 Tax=Streptomyces sp. NPDC056257 TaxID=3345765 RepID=UPI0035E1096C
MVAASGSFGRAHRPDLPGLETFAGQVLHAADYRGPARFAGQRVVVIGVGNSAVQIAAELALESRTSLSTRAPVRFTRQHLLGKDLHFWLTRTGLDTAPLGRLLKTPSAPPATTPTCRTSPDSKAPLTRPDTPTTAAAPPLPVRAWRSSGWRGSAACPRTRCAASAVIPPGRPADWPPPPWPAPDPLPS